MKYLKDALYALVIVGIAVGAVTLRLPRIDIDIPVEPVALPTEAPAAPSNYIEAIEGIAASIQGIPMDAAALVLTFWTPDCPHCIKQLEQLNLLREQRPDVAVLALTDEADPARVDAIIQEMDLDFGVLYNMPTMVLSTVPHTHILFMVDGVWRLKPDGSAVGYMDMEAILGYIAKEERNNHQL